MIRYSCVLLFVLFAATLAINEDLVNYNNMKDFLPKGFDKDAFNLHSGYLTAGGTKRLHYLFYESQNYPKDDPVIFWIGTDLKCSTMFNAFYGTAPFGFVQEAKTISTNDSPWNEKANVLYLDGPAGVGFSRAENNTEYTTDDEQTVEQFFQAILNWHKKYPNFLRNELYLAGEGYAGIWAPLLAKRILDYNEDEGSLNKKINLAGVMLGNPFTDWDIDGGLMPLDNLYYRGIYGSKIRNDYVANCPKNPNSAKCNLTKALIKQVMEDVNDYDLAGPCYLEPLSPGSVAPTMQEIAEERRAHKLGRPTSSPVLNSNDAGKTPKCHAVQGLKEMMKNTEIKNAFHIDHASHEWTMCTVIVNYDTSSSVGSLPVWPELLKSDLRFLVFSGDTDSTVPTMTTLTWVRKLQKQMNLMTTKPWDQWVVNHGQEKEAGGFRQVYDKKLTVATVRGGPHSVTTHLERRPAVQLMIQNWLQGLDI